MNLNHMNDDKLLAVLKNLVGQERGVLTAILYHLKEVDRRRLYCDLKYESMREYAMAELKYAKDEADRRLAAMNVLFDVPEIESLIESGSLTLTNLVLAQVVFNKERKAGRGMEASEKLAFLRKLENVSTRQAQKIACAFCPEMTPRDLEVFQLQDLELRNIAEQLIRLHGLPNLNSLLYKLFGEELARLEACASGFAAPRDSTTRGESRCTNCGSLFCPEDDHIYPKAAGGSDSPENLRVLCRPCNQRHAIKFYGRKKMWKFLREPEIPYGIH